MNFQEPGFSFTFTIPMEKLVYYAGRRRKYGSLSNKQQHTFLCDLMTKCIWVEHYSYIDYVFEYHANNTLHLHGYAIVKEDYINFNPVYLLRASFYEHNQIVGIKPSVYERLSDIQQTKANKQYWFDYINKHQDEIVFKSHFTQEQEHKKQLDNGVKIERREEPPSEDYYDKYRFTGGRNNFILEI